MIHSLSIEKDAEFVQDFPNYCDQIRRTVKENVNIVNKSKYTFCKNGLFCDKNYGRWFTLTGAMQTSSLEDLGDARIYFRAKDGRLFRKGEKYILRGPRYLSAIDPSLSIPQKIAIFIEDLHEGIEHVKRHKNISPDEQYRCIAPVLDYVKNSIITLTNAFLNKEKRGNQNLADPYYNMLREHAINAGCHATYSFYMSLIGKFDYNSVEDELNNIAPTAAKLGDVLKGEYRNYALSSRDIVRPEASHPLVLITFAALLLDQVKGINTIIGLPSGGTEIAYLISQTFIKIKKEECDLLLLPISLHSMLTQYGEKSNLKEILPAYWRRHEEKITNKMILITDDNSSSGATLDAISSSLMSFCSNSTIEVAVAEADIERSRLDLKFSAKRNHYANPIVYKHSVSLLPISRMIWRKHDLKEVAEAFCMGSHFAKQAQCFDLQNKIKAEVFSVEAQEPFGRRVAEPDWEKKVKIDKFRNTFLSNFHKVTIPWRGKIFPSVEHAYQSSKFDCNSLLSMPVSLWQEILKMIELPVSDISKLFTTDCKSGNIKKIANLLTKHKLIRDNWDEIRVGIMIELLVTKFSNPDMRSQLLSTGNKYLIEGNDWGDTFWGACMERGKLRGRNILGLILMNIRKKITENIF